METHTIHFEGMTAAQAQCFSGSQDKNLNTLSELFGTDIIFRDDTVTFRCRDEQTESHLLCTRSTRSPQRNGHYPTAM